MSTTTTHRVKISENGFNRMSYSVTRVVNEPAKQKEDMRAQDLMRMLAKLS